MAEDWTFDVELWPVLVIQAPPVLTFRNWRKVFRELEDWLQQPWPTRKVFVTLEGGAPGFLHALDASPWFLRNRELMKEQLFGWGLVLPTPRVSLAVQFMLWLGPVPVPTPIFETKADAMVWALGLLRSG